MLHCSLNDYNLSSILFFTFQEMFDIMKSIYDMMGKYTYPTMQDDIPREHVESFFQVNNLQFILKPQLWLWSDRKSIVRSYVQKSFQ